MNPLNTFPNLLDYVFFTPLLLRFVLGVFIIYLGKERLRKSFSYLSLLYFIVGTTLILGFYTQISAILGIVVLKLDFYFDFWKNRQTSPVPRNYYFFYTIAMAVLASLLFTGAGAFAFDMPF